MANTKSNIGNNKEEQTPDTERKDVELDDSELDAVSGGTSFGVLLGGSTGGARTESLSLNFTKITS